MSKKIRSEEMDRLLEGILLLKDKEEAYQFFEDLCTVNELLSLSQRFEVASMLKDKCTFVRKRPIWTLLSRQGHLQRQSAA